MIEPIPPFVGFTMSTPVVPELYFEVETAEQRWLEICKWLQKLTEYAERTGNISNLNKLAIEKLQATFDEFKAHGFDDYYAEQVAVWIDEHLAYIYERTMKQVYFGLTSDGYFCAYVPDSWSDIEFDTGAMYGRSDYGRLILRYDVTNGQGVIDNTYHYSLANAKDNDVIDTLVKEVEHIGKTLWTVMSQPVEGGE